MGCCLGYPFVDNCERVFEVDTTRIAYGSGAMGELGANARLLGMSRVALFTDPGVARLPLYAAGLASLVGAGLQVSIFDRVHVEPTNESFAEAIGFAQAARADGYVSIGGGSTIDTAKPRTFMRATRPTFWPM